MGRGGKGERRQCGGGCRAYSEATWSPGKRSCHLDRKCEMFFGVTLSGVIIGVLSYEHSDNVTCT